MARQVMTDHAKIRKAREELHKSHDIDHVWKQGFPSTVDYETAIANATRDAKLNVVGGKAIIDAQIIQTPEHLANNEYLVSLTFGKLKD